MKRVKIITLALIFSIIFSLTIAYMIPSTDNYSPENPFWNGLKTLENIVNPVQITSITQLKQIINPKQTAILILGPEKPFTTQETQTIKKILEKGAIVLVADDFGQANTLLEQLEIPCKFTQKMLIDPVFYYKNPRLPKIFHIEKTPWTKNIEELTLNYATTLNITSSEIKILANSSEYSYLDINMNNQWDPEEPKGRQPILAQANIGEGTLLLLSDPSIFINSMINKSDNAQLLKNIIEGKTTYLDLSHYITTLHTQLKTIINITLNYIYTPEIKYTLIATTTIITLYTTRKTKEKEEPEKIEEIEEVLKKHPNWDRRILEKLREWREKFGANRTTQTT